MKYSAIGKVDVFLYQSLGFDVENSRYLRFLVSKLIERLA